MADQVPKVIVEVLAAHQVEDIILVTVKVLSGEMEPGMVLEVAGTEARWCVVNLAYIAGDAHREGMRGFSLQSLSGNLPLQPGILLQQVKS